MDGRLPPFGWLPAQFTGRSIVLVGLMGSGKTNVGRRLAARLGLQFRDADAEIEKAAGCTIAELFARYGEPQFRDEERRVMRQLLAADPLVLATGGGAFMDAETRSILRREAVSIWLRCGLPTLLQRVLSCKDRPLLQDSDPAAVMQRLVQERDPTYAEADLVIDSADESPEATTSNVYAALLAWQPSRRAPSS